MVNEASAWLQTGRDLVPVSRVASGRLDGALPARASFISILISAADLPPAMAVSDCQGSGGLFPRLDVDGERGVMAWPGRG